jgi:hypothetical protein
MGNEWTQLVPDDCECYYSRGTRRPYPGCPATHPPELGGPGERYPLVRHGEGWSELAEPEPGVIYEAWRVVCTDPECWAGGGGTGQHSHIETAQPLP